MICIRAERASDFAAIRRVICAAFSQCEFGYNGEADIVDQIRENCDEAISLVAIDGETVVGHILFSPATIQSPQGTIQGMGLGPMAVEPQRHREGIGKQLIEAGMALLKKRKCPFVVVLGHPDYYTRFEFVPAATYDVKHTFEGIPQDVFFIRMLDESAVQLISHGVVKYRPEFSQ